MREDSLENYLQEAAIAATSLNTLELMMKKLILGTALALSSLVAAAYTAPTATGVTFAQYTGTNVGSNDMPAGNALYWVHESTVGNVDSFLLMFDPVNTSATISGIVTFGGGSITQFFDTKAELLGSQGTYGSAGLSYGWVLNSGLENRDQNRTTVGLNTVTLNWRASSPGDYVRVLVTPVPEPETYAMLLAGLGLMGAVARRRKSKQA